MWPITTHPELVYIAALWYVWSLDHGFRIPDERLGIQLRCHSVMRHLPMGEIVW